MSDRSDQGKEILIEEIRVSSKELEDFGQSLSFDRRAVMSRLNE